MNVIGHCSRTHPHHEITCKSAHSHNYATLEHFPTEYSSRHPPRCPSLSSKTNKKKRNAENAKSKTTAHTRSGGKPTIALCNQRSSVCDSVQTWGGGQPPLSGDVPLTPGHSCRSPRFDSQINKDLPGFLVNTCTIHDPTSLSLSPSAVPWLPSVVYGLQLPVLCMFLVNTRLMISLSLSIGHPSVDCGFQVPVL